MVYLLLALLLGLFNLITFCRFLAIIEDES